MSRVQLAINVTDLDAAVDFYARLFGTEPAKRRTGYANFSVDEPALKLVLIENPEASGTLNHLGVEVFSTGEVTAAQRRLDRAGVATVEGSGTCCYARQEKVWVNDPDGAPWEIYTVVADSDTAGDHGDEVRVRGAGGCSTTELADVDRGRASVKGCC